MMQFTMTDSALGRVAIARTSAGVSAVLIGDSDAALEADLRARFGADLVVGDPAGMQSLARDVVLALEDPRRAIDIPLDMQGTSFQREVWSALRAIPAGETRSYRDVAAGIGRPAAVRAVAQACAANAIAVIVPCHRVVRTDGGLAGYRWGVERKRGLLDRESISP